MSNKIIRTITLVLLLSLSSFAGYLVAKKDNYSNTGNIVVSKTNSGFVENSLTQIQEKPIYGVFGAKKGEYGKMLYKVLDANHTEVLFRIENVPLVIKGLADNSQTQSTPAEMKLQLAKVCCGSLDYEYIETNSRVNFQVQNGAKFSDYSTILEVGLDGSTIDRLILNGEPANIFAIKKDGQKDWPRKVGERPAPYLWVDL